MAHKSPSADRPKPLRRHRAIADHEPELTDAEKNAAAHALAGEAVARMLLRDPSFQEALQTFEPAELASRYARAGSDGWNVLRLLAERYVNTRDGLDRSAEPVGHDRALICLQSSVSGWSCFDSEVTCAARARVAEAKLGATRLLARGAGRCCECDAPLYSARHGELWCSPCEQALPVPWSDRRQMQRSMNTALGALGRVAARGSSFAPVRPEPCASVVNCGACGTTHATGQDCHVCFWRQETETEARRLGLFP